MSVLSGVLALLAALGYLSTPAWAMCPNQALRAELHSEQLPDCRAYELVTPSAKDGWPVTSAEVASADGSHMFIVSGAAFQGSNSSFFNYYSIERTPSGWVTSPFVEPNGLFNLRAAPVDQSAGLVEGLFEYRLSSPLAPFEVNFYVRTLPDGTPVEVGPEFSHEALVDNPGTTSITTSTPSASSNLATMVFEIEAPIKGQGTYLHYLWPGDTTVGRGVNESSSRGFSSLYEYRGTGNSAPELVGVDQNGELIGQCGVSLGFPEEGRFETSRTEDTYNTISADGSRVFFTVSAATQGPSGDACTTEGAGHGPPADELFARTDESETTAISEPTKEDCSACDTGEPANAIFQGASEDGSKVFFLSGQRDLSPHAEGMNLYEYDFGASEPHDKLVRVSGEVAEPKVLGVARVAENGSRVYFVAEGVLTAQENEYGASAKEGDPNLYVYDTENAQTAFIGTLSSSDGQDWSSEDERPVETTPDGRFLLFDSGADLTPDDTSTTGQVFEYDAQERTLVRVSIGQNGFNEDGNSNVYGANIVSLRYSGDWNPASRLGSLSEDGSIAAFESSAALTPLALVGYPNVYEYHEGQVSLISDGEDRSFAETGPSVRLVGMDPSGANIFFTTADQLVPQDGNTQIDVYDARIDGGFALPTPASCEGEGCQGALAPSPLFGSVASATQAVGESAREAPVRSSTTRTKTKAKKKRRRRKGSVRRRSAAARADGSRRVARGSQEGGRA